LGSYSWDGKMVMFDLSEGTEKNKVYLYDEDSNKILYEWNDFWSWLSDEANRLSNLFDSNGVELYENNPTSPIF